MSKIDELLAQQEKLKQQIYVERKKEQETKRKMIVKQKILLYSLTSLIKFFLMILKNLDYQLNKKTLKTISLKRLSTIGTLKIALHAPGYFEN